jgi:hypothetical protein
MAGLIKKTDWILGGEAIEPAVGNGGKNLYQPCA